MRIKASYTWFLVSTLLLITVVPSQAIAQPSISVLRDIGNRVEITVTNPDEFYVGAMPYVLKIGEGRFTNSRHPADGDLHTLIFSIALQDFNQLTSGDSINLGYGNVEVVQAASNKTIARSAAAEPDNAKRQWSLGTLDKQLLRK